MLQCLFAEPRIYHAKDIPDLVCHQQCTANVDVIGLLTPRIHPSSSGVSQGSGLSAPTNATHHFPTIRPGF